MDGGNDASLIDPNQCAMAVNYTFRKAYASVRPPFSNLLFSFDKTSTQTNFTGIFQGACFYESAQRGQSGFVVSVAGRLFRITLGQQTLVSEITPAVALNVTSNFTVPSANTNVNVTINSETNVLPVGTTIYILGGKFTVAVVTGNTLTLTYISGYVPPAVPIVTTTAVNIPAPGSNLTVPVNNPGALAPTNTVYLAGVQYTIASITGNSINLTYVSGSQGTVLLAGTPFQNNLGADYTYNNYVVPAGTSITDNSGNQLFFDGINPPNLAFVHLFQAENYVIVLAGQNETIFYNGSVARLATVKELPPGFIGTYQWGRCWITLNDRRSFVAGDLVGSSSGTANNLYVDAILKMTENTFLNGGGTFKVPNNAGLICAMGALPTLDTSLGVGQVLVGTSHSIIGVNAPADRTTWQNLSYPIQSVSALGYGPVAPRAMCAVNSDVWFRSLDGDRSFQIKRRDFQTWSDTPQSFELDNILSADTRSLLFYASADEFDNKKFCTVSPYVTPYGILHRGLSVVNFDEISNLRGNSSPAWEGVTTGLQIFQFVKGVVDGVDRAFVFASNNGTIELWEVLRSGAYDLLNGTGSIAYKSIPSILESRRDGFGDDTQLKGLYTAELYLDEISDNVAVTVKWRPDQYPIWSTWAVLNFCATQQQCQLVPQPSQVNLIPAGAQYSVAGVYNFNNLAIGNVYILVFGANELSAYYDPHGLDQPITNSVAFVATTTSLMVINGTSNNIPVTAKLYLQSAPVTSCNVFKQNASQYAARVMLTAPPELVNQLTNGYLHEGYEFQFRFEGSGHFRIRQFKAHAKMRSDKMEGEQQTVTCQALPICNLPIFNYDVHN